jgi:glycosyltransferase involved in cell wall biosynthesis
VTVPLFTKPNLRIVKGKVSVVLPVRFVNYEWLDRSISSVLTQDYPNLELIIVNDGATMDIDDLIKFYRIKKYVQNPKNMKLPYSLNRGFEIADGEYHTWTSADNFMLPEMIRRLVEELNNYQDFSIAMGRSKLIDDKDSFVNAPDSEPLNLLLSGSDTSSNVIERKYTFYSTLGACFLYRNVVWQELNGYDERLHGSEDYDFWIRASRKFKIRRLSFSEPPYYVYRCHSNSISANTPGCFSTARLAILEREHALYPEDMDITKAITHYRRTIRLEHNKPLTTKLNLVFTKFKKKLPSFDTVT